MVHGQQGTRRAKPCTVEHRARPHLYGGEVALARQRRVLVAELGAERALPYCLRQAARDTALMRPALGRLADRHLRFVTGAEEKGATS